MTDMKAEFLKHLDDVLDKYQSIKDPTDLDIVFNFFAFASAAIRRVVRDNSSYWQQADALVQSRHLSNFDKTHALAGIVRALREDVNKGYIHSVEELVHADLFTDFLEMADHLLDEGYKDPAAVLGGGVLEEQLRQLCNGNSISVVHPDGKAKKADQMNSDLAGKGIYQKGDQKSVTAWLDLRNKAAHGKYTEYTKDQVALFIQSIRDFITRNPA